MEVRSYSYFRWCGYFWSPWVSFVTTDEFSVRVTKITSRICVSWTHSLPSNIDEVFSINSSANVFVFGDLNIHHKEWLNYSGGTDRSRELCYNFSISNDLTQVVNFPAWIPDCNSVSSSDASICSTMAFSPLWNSDHVFVSVSIDFPSNLQRDVFFLLIAYDYSRAAWDGLCDHLRDVSWEDQCFCFC